MAPPHRLQQHSVVIDGRLQVRMGTAHRPREMHKGDQDPARQRLGFSQTVGGLQQLCKVVEIGGDSGVVGAEGVQVDG